MTEVSLSLKRLGRAARVANQDKQFKFIVGKEQTEYCCSLFQACFISEKACRLVTTDSTITVLRILPNEKCEQFELIERLWNGQSITVDNSNADSLFRLNEELENEELASVLVNLTNEPISVKNAISRLRLKSRLGLEITEELEFVSSNFSQFDISGLSSLRPSELENILVEKSLQVESEDSLFDSVSKLVSCNESFSVLFKYIRFEYLNPKHLEMFFNTVYPGHIDCLLWESITKFITNSDKKPMRKYTLNDSSTTGGDVFECDSSAPFNGIFSYLRDQCCGNPHKKGLINITSSPGDEEYDYNIGARYQIIDYGWSNCWYLYTDWEQPWIRFDFKNQRISLEIDQIWK